MALTEEQIQKISENCNHKVIAKFEIEFHFDIGHMNNQSITDFVQQELDTYYTKDSLIKEYFTEENFKEIVNWEDNYCDDCEDEYLSYERSSYLGEEE